MNPIENLWHELKEFIRREVKPRTKQELVDARNAGRCVLLYSHSMYLSAICVQLVVDNGLYSMPYLRT